MSPDGGKGFVSLVGAGPGDPELLTLRALRRLQQADAVVYDRLIGAEVLDLGRPGAARYDVGKFPGSHACAQEEINALLVRLGRQGQRVVRLKGGDPFVYGRGGEEALALAVAGVPYEIVPGVSSALAAPAAAGIPVTHRGLARSVTIVAGHGAAGLLEDEWRRLAHAGDTLVFLMVVENLERVVKNLIAQGRDADEPAAVIRWGTTSRQVTVRAPLGRIADETRARGVRSPAVLVTGPSVGLGEAIAAGMRTSDDGRPAR